MRSLQKNHVFRFIRVLVCAFSALVLLSSASQAAPGLMGARDVLAAQKTTERHETKHKTTHTKGHKAAPSNAHGAHRVTRHATGSHHRTHASTHHHARHTVSHHPMTRRELARYRRLHGRHRRRHLTRRELARSRHYQKAFIASSQLRPMAQQLATLLTPAAFDGVTRYAHDHSGEAAAAAWLALGHAYMLDHKYTDAVAALHNADRVGTSLDDYAAYLSAQAYLAENKPADAQPVLAGFAKKFPDSIFVPRIPVLEANLYLQQGDPQYALRVLDPHKAEAIANKPDFLADLAKGNLMAGNKDGAETIYRHIYLDYPLSSQAVEARTQLVTLGVLESMPISQRRLRADALYGARHWTDAELEYRSLAASPSLTDGAHNAMLVAVAACEWKLHTLKKHDVEELPDTNDEAGARRLYLLMELARDDNDSAIQQSLVKEMETRFPTSPWLAEALLSSGNMYLLTKDYPTAVRYYVDLSTRFPYACDSHHSGPCFNGTPGVHWRAAWLTYRLGDFAGAARMMDEQIREYPDSPETSAALYWRARIYAEQEHDNAMAVKYFRTVARVYRHYYYANLAEQRLADMGYKADDAPTGSAMLDALEPEDVPELSADIPDQDPHLVKARLLANAGLNEYISPEIQAADGSDEWGSLAEAQIYASYGEPWHALHLMKRAIPYYTTASYGSIPLAYWRILFPQPYWSTIKRYSAQYNLDPYMVASLIRQESEFNPGVVSYANAYGLMQLLPRVGRELARKEGIRHFSARDLLNPEMNIRLGCLYLRQMLDEFSGHSEYAFAAYNAGDNRVNDWQSAGQFKDMDVFVESIPFTQTRDYVQAIVRNEEIYRSLDRVETQRAAANAPTQTVQ